MAKMLKKRFLKLSIITVCTLVFVVIGMKLLSIRTHDPSNPRSRPNGYLMSHTVIVKKSPEEVFNFITYHMAEHNLSLAKAHDKFYFTKGKAITPGAVFVAEEYQEKEGVKNTYVVKKVVPNQLIYYASTPTIIYEKIDGKWEQTSTCNAYVYFDIEDHAGNTKMTQTIVIEMQNFFTKFLIDMVIMGKEGNEWMDHLVEELESLKAAIEA